jgi:hypothetical protein
MLIYDEPVEPDACGQGCEPDEEDRIPSQAILSKRRHALQAYWKALLDEYPERFVSEVRMALTGRSHPDSILIAEAFLKLVEKRRFLVENQGYPEWNP